MGGLGPGIGGLEYLVIGIVALLVVGPERLPGLLRQLGKMVAKVRGMANDFRSSFDEMARQSELDDLRKEVEALRTGQGAIGQGMVKLGADADAAFKDIKTDLEKVDQATASPAAMTLDQPEFPEPTMTPLPRADADTVKPRATRSKAATATAPSSGKSMAKEPARKVATKTSTVSAQAKAALAKPVKPKAVAKKQAATKAVATKATPLKSRAASKPKAAQ